jgi:hypothetical protein
MACYSIPLIAAIVIFATRKHLQEKIPRINWLNQLLAGGAVMLIIDHLWNGELLLIGENVLLDLALGFAMTAGVFLFWLILVYASTNKKALATAELA